MSHSSANFYTDSILLEKVEGKNDTLSSSADSMLNSSYEEVISDSEIKETSCNDSTELSQKSSSRDKRNQSPEPDENDNIILKSHRIKIQPEDAGQRISTLDVPSVTERSTFGDSSFVDSSEASDDMDVFDLGTLDAPSVRERSTSGDSSFVDSSEASDDEMSGINEALCIVLGFRVIDQESGDEALNTSTEDQESGDEALSPSTEEVKSEGEDLKVFRLEDVFSKLQCTSLLVSGEIDVEAEINKVTSATAENVDAKLRNKFLHDLHRLWKMCRVNKKLDLNVIENDIQIKVEGLVMLIIRLCKRKILFNEKDTFIAYLILPVIKPIVLLIKLSVIRSISRVDLLRKKSALKFLVDNFGELQVNGTNLCSFLEKPFEYCNYLLDNVLLNRQVINTDDKYLEIDNSGLPPNHIWWFRKEYLHDMMPGEEHLRPHYEI